MESNQADWPHHGISKWQVIILGYDSPLPIDFIAPCLFLNLIYNLVLYPVKSIISLELFIFLFKVRYISYCLPPKKHSFNSRKSV
jgi:hypothetical protein